MGEAQHLVAEARQLVVAGSVGLDAARSSLAVTSRRKFSKVRRGRVTGMLSRAVTNEAVRTEER